MLRIIAKTTGKVLLMILVVSPLFATPNETQPQHLYTVGTSSQKNIQLGGDSDNHSVVFESPASGSTFDVGATIPLKVTGDIHATSVRYYDGASLIGEVDAPYRFQWNTATRGAHTISAVAGDKTNSVNISVNDPTTPVNLANDVDRYNVAFTTLGQNARDSMPLGNGDISLNAWTYDNGDVGLLIGKLDAYSGKPGASGAYSLRKIGRVRISIDPPVFKEAAAKGEFKQTLVLSQGVISMNAPENHLKIWVDKNHPVIHAQLSGERKVILTVQDNPWRTNNVEGVHLADKIFTGLTNQVAWCYYDPRTDIAYRNAHERGVWEAGMKDADLLPQLTTVCFGALIEGAGFKSIDVTTLRSDPATESRIDIHVLRYSKNKEATPEAWLAMIQKQVDEFRKRDIVQIWKDHREWWRNYWDRGYLRITAGPQHEDVTSQYLQQRFLNACQTGPMKELWRVPFNGGLFNIDFEQGKGIKVADIVTNTITPDYRTWGASDRPQNTRHVYWPRLLTGDFDQGRTWYLWPSIVSQDWGKTVEANTSLHDSFISVGCSAWENLSSQRFTKRDDQVAGRILPAGAGKKNGGRSNSLDVADEYLPYMIDYYELTQDDDFLENRLVPYAEGLFRFFDTYFTRDIKGKLVLWPCMSSEVYVKFPENGYIPANPMAGVALIHSQLPRLLAFKGKPGVTPQALALWKKVYDERPDIPVSGRRNGKPGLAPHEPDWDMEQKQTQSVDRASLYAIWPYRAYMFPASGTSVEDYALATNTLALDDNGSSNWKYGDYCAAILGIPERARKGVLTRINVTGQNTNIPSQGYFRFPAFNYSAPNFTDYTPDQEGGNVVLSTLSYMLWNWKGSKIYLCPAWPKDWDCDFKFHGPLNTVVQGHVTCGKVAIDKVIPESHRGNIVVCQPR
jgi:alpha-L-fucosidase 2